MSEPTFSLYPVKGATAFMIVFLAGMAALSASMAISGWVMGWLCFFSFALWASLFADQLFIRGAAIDVSREGICDVRFSPDLIPWSAVEGITRYSLVMVVLWLKKGDRGKFTRSRRRMISDVADDLCEWIGWRCVRIGTIGLSGSADGLLAAIEQFAPAHVVLPTYNRPVPVVEAPETPADPNEPDYWLRNPPADARVEYYKDRRVVTLKDRRVVAELMTGRGRWFTSFEEFRDFIGD
jgi:hypothetical protein